MKIIFALIFLFIAQVMTAQTKATVVFKIPEKDLIPEGMTYDAVGKKFYVGSIHKRKVIKITSTGAVSDFTPSLNAGLFSVLGMTVKDQQLWVCNNSPEYDSTRMVSCLHIFDLKNARLFKKYALEDGKKHLFNDVVVTADGTGYVTDSDGGAVYRIRTDSDTVETFIRPGALRYPNGLTLTPDEKRLIVSTGSGLGIVTIDLESRVVTPLQHEKYFLIGADGLYRYHNSLVAVQNVTFPEAILEYSCNSGFTAIKSVNAWASNLAEFDSPTTGVIVGDDFYFIANSQLLQTTGTKGSLKNPAELKEPLIMRISLKH